MKARILVAFALAALVVAFAYTAATPAAPHKAASNALPAATAPPTTTATPAATNAAEPHPEIREAIGALRRAKGHMEHAAHDFGGHRVDALHATDEAIHQLELCLKFDKD